ncbi:MAG: ABC transporter permease subunit [Planctomycetota bacterium]|nr:ABC transporter permease subunit [Planctomycetota bacterium]
MNLLGMWLWRLLPGNPVVVRIVQNGSRRARHLWIRMGYLGALIVLVFVGIVALGGVGGQQSLASLAKSGQWVFALVAYGQVILICLIAPLFMAGAIAAEQSGKTFSILLTTPLSNVQIVLGSLVGRLFFVLALLASGLPVFAILQIFGGVRIAAVFVCFAVAALSAILVGSVAITLAVLRIGGRKAVFIFVIAIAAYLVGGYVADHALRPWLAVAPGTTTWLTPLHPILVLESSLRQDYAPPPLEIIAGRHPAVQFYLGSPFSAFAAITSLGSLALFLWGAIRVRAVGQRAEGGGSDGWLVRKLRLWRGGDRVRPSRLVWANPIAWREAQTRGNKASGILARWGFVLLAVAAGAANLVLYHRGILAPADFASVLEVLLSIEVAVVVLVAVYMSAGSVSREREDGSLDLLLTTPITPRFYVWGKLRGLVSFLTLLLAAPIITLAMVSIYTLVGQALHWKQVVVARALPSAGGTPAAGGPAAGNFPLLLPEAPILLALMLVPFVAACVAVGMTQSVRAKGVLGAVLRSWPLAVYLLFMAAVGYRAAESWWLAGTVINALSPATGPLMIINPWERVEGFATEPGPGRFILLFSTAVAGCGYGFFVYSVFTTMVAGFDHTVRRISGAAG